MLRYSDVVKSPAEHLKTTKNGKNEKVYSAVLWLDRKLWGLGL